mgnify:CR=1 FL=1
MPLQNLILMTLLLLQTRLQPPENCLLLKMAMPQKCFSPDVRQLPMTPQLPLRKSPLTLALSIAFARMDAIAGVLLKLPTLGNTATPEQ